MNDISRKQAAQILFFVFVSFGLQVETALSLPAVAQNDAYRLNHFRASAGSGASFSEINVVHSTVGQWISNVGINGGTYLEHSSFLVFHYPDPTSAVDSDGDSVLNTFDNCPTLANTDQMDGDFDDVGDVCDTCLGYQTDEDSDNDGLLDVIEDANGNGIWELDLGETNFCDPDTDEDGIADGWEVEHNLNPVVDNGANDADGDNYTDLQEYLNDIAGELDPDELAYDPYFINTPGGTGYVASNEPTKIDFNKDGKSDILWRHTNGYTTAWLMNDTTEIWNGFGVLHSSFVIKALGDFNGDGRTDILWRHPTSGDTKIWLTYGTGKTQVDLGIVSTSYTLQDVGDFNGDGKTDILWRHSGGFTTSWQMDGISKTQVDYGTISTDYQFQGVGDFNNDGKSDILWRHTGGYAVIWQMDGSTMTQVGLGTISNEYGFQGVGDFNGDGNDEILWRHSGGFTTIWRVAGSTKTWIGLGTIDPAYNFKAIADFNGDNKAEILWRHSGGFTTIWRIESDTEKSWVGLGTINIGYQFKGVGDYNGDGGAEILWRHTNGFTTVWRVDGVTRSWLNIGDISTDYSFQPAE